MALEDVVQFSKRYSLREILKNLSPEENNALSLLKEKLIKESIEVPADFTLVRFLVARGFDVNNAMKMYMDCMEWRKKEKIDEILDVLPFHENKIKQFRAAFPCAYHGHDKAGHPIYIEKLGRLVPHLLLDHFTLEESLRVHLFSQELNMRRTRFNSLKLGQTIECVTRIMDLEGLSLSHRTLMHLLRAFIDIDAPNYPERMSYNFIINAPSIFPIIWDIAKGWIEPRTVSKIFILGRDYQDIMLQKISSDQLPNEYGGKCRCHNTTVCIPFYDEHELARLFVEDATKKKKTIKVDASSFIVIKEQCKVGCRVEWEFSPEFSIGFHVEYSDGTVVVSDKQIQDGIWFQGSFVPKSAGELTLKFHNFAYFSSCEVKIHVSQSIYDEEKEKAIAKDLLWEYFEGSKEWEF